MTSGVVCQGEHSLLGLSLHGTQHGMYSVPFISKRNV